MRRLHSKRSFASFCLLAAVATPFLAIASQIAAAPFYPGYSFRLQSASMLGTRFSLHPWIFNAGEMITGLVALCAAFGLFQSFRRKTHILVSVLIGFAVACGGVMTLKAGMFPMPDPRHNSWALLFSFIVVTPHLMLIGLWKQRRNTALRAYLLACIVFLVLLVPLKSRVGRGTLQRLLYVGTSLPIGVVGFSMWRELRAELPAPIESASPSL